MKKTTLCYLENNGRYLMLYRNKKENDQSQGKWLGIGGKFETWESPDECVCREVMEETGLTISNRKLRGIIKFVSDIWETEYMFLYSSDSFYGELKACDEGELHWIEKEAVYDLPVWEGDKEIFKALESCDYFFIMEVVYEGDMLVNKPVCTPSPLKRLFELQDKDYGVFQSGLIPGIDVDTVIGVRIPILRKLAKEYGKTPECSEFIRSLPHIFYDEYLFHAILISEEEDYDRAVALVDELLPYINNWAVCDTLSPKVFNKNRTRLIEKIRAWSSSEMVYTCRFGLKMLMTHFLDTDFNSDYLEIPAAVKSEEYYIRMMVAWFFATALAKQWETALPYIENRILEPWIHNKTIQKARESFRLSQEQKEYLKNLKC